MTRAPRPASLLAGLATAALLLGACSAGPDDASSETSGSSDSSSPSAPTSPGSSDSASDGASDDAAEPDGEQYVALGDSYTSAPLVPSTDTSDPCLRSDGNYPSLVAAELGYDLDDVSCAGASSTSMIGVQRTSGDARPAQFDALGRGTDLVTLGIGGNDVELFTTIFQRCLPLAQQDPEGSPCADELVGTSDDLLPAVRSLDERVEAIVTGIEQRAPRARVVVVTYPQLLPSQGTCEQVPLAAGDYDYVRRVNAALSQAVAAGGRAAGADVVDVLGLSRGHDVCSDDPWVNGVQTDPERALAFHPFAEEQQAVADALVELVG